MRVKSNLYEGSGNWSAGGTLAGTVPLVAHEIGHAMLSFHTCPPAPNYGSGISDNTLSIMCGPRVRSMSASDRSLLGWLSPRFASRTALANTYTLNADPIIGDALWILGSGNGQGDISQGDILIEARTFDSPWHGVPDFSDGDHDDIAFPSYEGLYIYKRLQPGLSSSPSSQFSSMDNTGLVGRRSVNSGTVKQAVLRGLEPPHIGFSSGDAYTPLSRYLFNFYESISLDSTIGVYNIEPAASQVSFAASSNFLTDATLRTVRTSYTLGSYGQRASGAPLSSGATPQYDRNLARRDDWTFGGQLTFAGRTERIYGGDPEITLLPNTRLAVASGGLLTLWGPDSNPLQVRAGAGARMSFYDEFFAKDTRFEASDPAFGWSGIYLGPDPLIRSREVPQASPVDEVTNPVFSGVTISGVRYLSGLEDDPIPPNAAIEIRDRRVLFTNGTEITGSQLANGIFALGSGAAVVVTGNSLIESNGGLGIYATAGAQLYVGGDASINLNSVGGIYLNGYGTYADIQDGAQINRNTNVGVSAVNQAYARIRAPNDVGTSVSRNDGGLAALVGGSIDGGQCVKRGDPRPNLFENNYDPQGLQPFDARAKNGSFIDADVAFWGFGRSLSDLELDDDKSSTIIATTIAEDGTTIDDSCYKSSEGMSYERGTGGASTDDALARSVPQETPTDGLARGPLTAAVVVLASEARMAAWDGDPDAAFALLTDAADASLTDDDREAVYAAIGALVAEADSALSVPALVETLEATSGTDGPNRLWARRALAVAYAVTGRRDEADGVADGLTFGDTHAAFGHSMRVRLAVEADSLEMAVERLTAFAGAVAPTDTLAVETLAASRALVTATFPGADLSAAARGTASRGTGGDDPLEVVTSEASATRGVYTDEVSAYPNPAQGRGTVRVSVSEPAERASAAVYDALGRRVAVLHDGPLAAGPHAFAFGRTRLAAGVYVVQVRVTPQSGAEWRQTLRVTIVR